MAQLSKEMAVTVFRTKVQTDKQLYDQIKEVYRSLSLYGMTFLVTGRVAEEKEYPNGWLLRFRDYGASEDSLLVLVRDDDRIYVFGISAQSELNIDPSVTGRPEERFLNPEGDAPRLYGRSDHLLPGK